MHILFVNDHYEAQFTLVWEIEQLAERGNSWVPSVLPGRGEAIGEIHAATHKIRLFSGVAIGQRQVVNLCPPDEPALSLEKPEK